MSPVQAIKTGVAKSFKFKGRAARSEFWWLAVSVLTFPFVAAAIFETLVPEEPLSLAPYLLVLSPFLLWFSLPAAMTRRAIDADFSPLIWVYPTVTFVTGGLILIYSGILTPLEYKGISLLLVAFSAVSLLAPSQAVFSTDPSTRNEVPS
ncbi:DUF805 domain-containing protein [Yoonia sp.]|uniref:DUF805 domain-containing protein n=1 Tax=Yoonia sp. TaxID=2212373 RepID=UPI0035C87A12